MAISAICQAFRRDVAWGHLAVSAFCHAFRRFRDRTFAHDAHLSAFRRDVTEHLAILTICSLFLVAWLLRELFCCVWR
ncbi:hypothetical protein N9N71_02955, partial [Synechococcus sp. AH-229-G18]|nr:hypothetical protein [Synechococcus sp. AH-229-G18]